ncbi:MAG: hypothetical protein ACOCTG_04435, partial [Bacteroidota bacterium]
FDGTDQRLFSYDRNYCVPLPDDRERIKPFVAAELLAEDDPARIIKLRDLIAAWSNPSQFFCNSLGLRLGLEDLTVEDIEPQRLDGLDTYLAQQAILDRLLSTEPEPLVRQRMTLDGALPAGTLGEMIYRRLRREIEPLRRAVEQYGERYPMEIDVEVDGWRIAGRVEHLTDEAVLHFRPGQIRGKDLAAAWITHLVVAQQGLRVESVVVGRHEQQTIEIFEDPRPYLQPLVARFAEIRTRPIPLYPLASRVFADREQWDSALATFRGSPHARGDMDDHHVALVCRHGNPIESHDPAFETEALAFWKPITQHLRAE